MSRDEALAKYLALKNAKRQGVITDEEFSAKVSGLTFADEHGRECGIDPASDRIVNRSGDAAASAPAAAEKELPSGFFALLALIVGKTLTMFLRRLPLTILIGVAAMLFHTYLLVVVNNGYLKAGALSSVLSINRNMASSTVVWMVGSAIVMGLLGRLFSFWRKKKRVTLRERITAVTVYFRRKRFDTFAVIAASVGLALIIGALVNGSANLTLALGAGALLASRAGSVVALLARTAWNNTFTLFRSKTIKEHGLAIGYVATIAGSAGFLVSSVLTPNGTQLGIVLLLGALAFAVAQRMGLTGLSSFLIFATTTSAAALLFGLPDLALAHDGGWPEYMGNAPLTPANIRIFLQKGGVVTALMYGVPPGAAAAVGAALAQALNTLGQSVPDLDDGTDDREKTSIRDGDAARDWMKRNGYTDADGNPTQKFRDWMNAPHSAGAANGLRGYSTDPDGNIVIITADDAPDSTDDPTARSDRDVAQPSSDTARADGGDGSADADQGTDGQDPETHYNDPEWSSRKNPDPANMDWDPDQNRWRRKDDIYADKMTRQGYGLDPDTGAWRKPPDPPDLADVPDYSGTKYSTELRPGLITYDVTTDGLDDKLNNLDRLQRDALDAYRDLDDKIAQAERDGDTWLADQLRQNRDAVRQHIGDIQRQRTNIVNAVNDENRRISDYNDKITKPGVTGHAVQALRDGADIAQAIVDNPSLLTQDPDFVNKVRAGIDAANRVRKGEGVELRPGLFGYDVVKTGPSLVDKFGDAIKDVKDLSDQLDDARQRGDSEAVNRLTGELNAAKDRAQGLSTDLQNHVKDINKWHVKSANANLSIGRKGTEIVAEVASVPSTAHAVTNLIDDFNRGQGLFNRNVFRENGDSVDLDLDNPSVKGPVRMTPHDVDLDAQFHSNVRIGTERANRVLEVLDDPNASDADVAEAVNRALESRNSKLTLNSQSDEINQKFHDAVQRHRTNPLLERTSENLNSVKLEDGRSRYCVVDPETGAERPVSLDDWRLASGPKSRPSVGQDLDFYNPDDRTIIDRLTGKPVKADVVNGAIDDACDQLNINRQAQEINYTHAMEAESYRLRQGQTPKDHIMGAADFDPNEARHAADITDYKIDHAQHNYDTEAAGISEGARASNKELNRIVDRMLQDPKHAQANLPSYFSNKTAIPRGDGDYKTVLEVLADVGNDRMPTGTGQAAIRGACGRDIPTLNHDIARLQESIIKLRPGG